MQRFMSSGALTSVLGTLLHLLCYRKVDLSSITCGEVVPALCLCVCRAGASKLLP